MRQLQHGQKQKKSDSVRLRDGGDLKPSALDPVVRPVKIESRIEDDHDRDNDHERLHVNGKGDGLHGCPEKKRRSESQEPGEQIGNRTHKYIDDSRQPIKILLILFYHNLINLPDIQKICLTI